MAGLAGIAGAWRESGRYWMLSGNARGLTPILRGLRWRPDFSMLHYPKLRFTQTLSFQRQPQPPWWLIHGLISEYEGAPMHGDGLAGTNVLMNPDRLFRCHVHRSHEPAWVVSADR